MRKERIGLILSLLSLLMTAHHSWAQGDDIWARLQSTLGGDAAADRRALDSIPVTPQAEAQIGEAAWSAFVASLTREHCRLTKRGKDVAYLTQLASELHSRMAHAQRYSAITVCIAEQETTDARAFAGGRMVVTRGLLDYVPSEAALVGVLAHELSHIDRQHLLDPYRLQKLGQTTFAGGPVTIDQFVETGQVMVRQFMRPFRPEQEAEADRDAVEWLFDAGYDPLEMARLFLRMHQRDGQGVVPPPSFLRTHPYHVERYRAVEEATGRLRAAAPDRQLYVGRENLRRRIPKQREEFPNEAGRREP